MDMDMDVVKLASLESRLRQAMQDPKDATRFQEVLRESMNTLMLLHQDIADECETSRPSVTRWVNGLNAPTVTVRKALYDYLLGRTLTLKRRAEEFMREKDRMAA